MQTFEDTMQRGSFLLMAGLLASTTGCNQVDLSQATFQCKSQVDCIVDGDDTYAGYVCAGITSDKKTGTCVKQDNSAVGVEADTLSLGITGPFADGDTDVGNAVLEGVKAAIALRNDDGGIDGRMIELLSKNDNGIASETQTGLEDLKDKVFAFVAPIGEQGASAVANLGGKIVFGPRAGAKALYDADHVYTLRPSLEDEMKGAVKYLTKGEALGGIPAENVSVFAEATDLQGNSLTALGQAGVDNTKSVLGAEFSGFDASSVKVTSHLQNTVSVNGAVGATLGWMAESGRAANETGAKNIGIVLASTSATSATFVKELLTEFHKIKRGTSAGADFELSPEQAVALLGIGDIFFWSPSTTGNDTLARTLRTFGTFTTVAGQRTFCGQVYATNTVGTPTSAYRAGLGKANSNVNPTREGQEGFEAANLLLDAIQAHGPNLSTDSLKDWLQNDGNTLTTSSGESVNFADRRGLSRVFGGHFNDACSTDDVDLERFVPTGGGGGGNDCPDGICQLTGTILEDTTLTSNNTYVLVGTVFVGDDQNETVLTIEPGTTIVGQTRTKGTLVIRRSSRLEAAGTAESPIVFTGEGDEGARAPGSWGGVIINGRAPINHGNTVDAAGDDPAYKQHYGEGGTGYFGGFNANDNSGTLNYVRIEYAGGEISPGNELNGLALQGVGRATEIDHVQVHMGQDDGVEFYGGTVNAKHLLLTGNDDDSLDWTMGWTGNVQFVVVQQYAGRGDQGIEADNNGEDEGGAFRNNEPRSNPTLTNLTLIGSPESSKSDLGILLREGTAGQVHNSIVLGFNDACIDVDHAETFESAIVDVMADPQALTGALVVQNNIVSCRTPYKDDMGELLNVANFVENLCTGNTTATITVADGTPVTNSDFVQDPFNEDSPNFTPTGDLASGADFPAGTFGNAFFDASVSYRGGVAPDSNWTAGWTTSAKN